MFILGRTEVAGAAAQLIQMYIAELLRLFPFQINQTPVKNILLASVKLHLCSTNSEYDNYVIKEYRFVYLFCMLPAAMESHACGNAPESLGMEDGKMVKIVWR